jgi:hypothetical protein
VGRGERAAWQRALPTCTRDGSISLQRGLLTTVPLCPDAQAAAGQAGLRQRGAGPALWAAAHGGGLQPGAAAGPGQRRPARVAAWCEGAGVTRWNAVGELRRRAFACRLCVRGQCHGWLYVYMYSIGRASCRGPVVTATPRPFLELGRPQLPHWLVACALDINSIRPRQQPPATRPVSKQTHPQLHLLPQAFQRIKGCPVG